jgi:CheY-like chemotaxis protein
MAKYSPIILVEDDEDDKFFFENIVRQLDVKNELLWFTSTEDAYDYLDQNTKSIFLIFCDINLPGRNGLEFKRDIDTNPALRKRSIPFVFYSTLAHKIDVDEAFGAMNVQGFFKKCTNNKDSMNQIKTIIDYWSESEHPNK